MGTQQFCLRWNNHQTNLVNIFDHLLETESFVDVTLACEGLSVKAHKMVLSACSPYFQNLFLNNPCQHPIVILKDTTFFELQSIVRFMYKGEVNISQDQLPMFLKTAEALKVRGLAEVASEHSQPPADSEPPPQAGYDAAAAPVEDVAELDVPLQQPESPPSKRKRIRPRRRSRSGSANSETTGDVLDAHLDLQNDGKFPNSENIIKVEVEEHSMVSEELDIKMGAMMPNHSDLSMEEAHGSDKDQGLEELGRDHANNAAPLAEGSWLSEHTQANIPGSSVSISQVDEDYDGADSLKKAGRLHYKGYPQENMDQAVEAVLRGKMPTLQASRIYQVPNTTLRRYVSRLQQYYEAHDSPSPEQSCSKGNTSNADGDEQNLGKKRGRIKNLEEEKSSQMSETHPV